MFVWGDLSAGGVAAPSAPERARERGRGRHTERERGMEGGREGERSSCDCVVAVLVAPMGTWVRRARHVHFICVVGM